ncbi:uncharacterized protein B0P05DRAFT_473718, partial [Gilbertella persicaria]|uniref:uncharacterized protein n=1 Tax=Gilbertella persicaria TaxID=101096 RepID=UPI00221EB188
WHLGWLPYSCPFPCPLHPHRVFSKTNAIDCLQVQSRLQTLLAIDDSYPFY